ncbi:hypothetical protein ACIQUY_29475 [Streptomyces sp. NPDC090231]|uniref:hypothetical protein n=1 Tax=unclassified Streptomyces TaxID=2593676 RepID=UPI0037FA37C9
MNAGTASAALASLLDRPPVWLPNVDHWEVAHDGDRWIVQGQLAGDPGEWSAFKALQPIAEQSGRELADDGRLVKAGFEVDDVPCNVWWLRPILRWVIPEQCATCPTKLGAPDVKFVRLGEGDREAPVICVSCRDSMQADWVTRVCKATELDDHHWWFSAPADGWQCTHCGTVRTNPHDMSTTTRPPRAGEPA